MASANLKTASQHLPAVMLWLVSGLLALHVPLSWAQETQQRPKIGLVLPGGGAHGLAHIGVLKTLEALDVPIDYISGTSMGALVGGLYASGLSASEIENFVSHVNWDQTFTDENSRYYLSFRRKEQQFDYFVKGEFGFNDKQFRLPGGLVLGQQQSMLLKGMTLPVSHIQNFDDLPIPFRAVATDAKTGDEVILNSGDLAEAMRASMSVPGIFSPVKIDGRYLVDGGVTNNTPIDVVKEMGADIVIVSDTHDTRLLDDELDSYVEITSQIISSMITTNSLLQLKQVEAQDIVIRPIIPETVSSSDFDRFAYLIHIGEKAALRHQDQLKKLARPMENPPPFQRRLPVIDAIHIDNQTQLSDQIILNHLSQPVGKPLDRTRLETELTQLYGQGFFELLTYDVETREDKKVLNIYAKPPSWGPNFFKLKFNLASNLGDTSLFNLGLRHLRIPVNAYGGEWRNEMNIGESQQFNTALYQPLGLEQKFYVEPKLEFYNHTYSLNNPTLGIATIQLEQQVFRAGVAFGVNLTPRENLSLTNAVEDNTFIIGKDSSSQVRSHYNNYLMQLNFTHDSLDQLAFPHAGSLLKLGYHRRYQNDITQPETQEYTALFSHYTSWQRHTLNLYLEATDLDASSSSDVTRFYTLGGFQKLSGFHENELLGNKIVFGRLKYYYRVSKSNNPMNFPYYIGATLEAGNVYDEGNFTGVNTSDFSWENTEQAGSVFVGMNTFVGPLYFAYGYHSPQKQSFYFYFGHAFN